MLFFELAHLKHSTDLHSKKNKTFIKVLNFLVICASIILVACISLQTFHADSYITHGLYLKIQFWICIFFIISFFVFLFISEHKLKFLLKYSVLLVLSIPYLSILKHTSIHLTSEQMYLISMLPFIRGCVALVILTLLLVERHSTALFISYIVLLISFIYLLSLVFFIFERNINPMVVNYGDAIWWACMTVTTNGSNITPVTTMGKVTTTLLAATGMTTFPIFTVYFTAIVNRLMKSSDQNSEKD